MSASSGAIEQIRFVGDSSKYKSTGSSYHIMQKKRHNLVCVVMMLNLILLLFLTRS